ncbi:TPA: hypothetical protein ACH3X1_011012 [Trebouxia sp. C0004]
MTSFLVPIQGTKSSMSQVENEGSRHSQACVLRRCAVPYVPTLADRGQDQHAELRQKAVDTLRSSVWIGTGLQDEQTAEYTLGKYPQQLCLYKQNPTGGASHLLASAIASPKTWAGTWSIKALAIALHRFCGDQPRGL